MAIALTKQSATPYSLKYSLGGGAGTATKSATQILADCAPGPLKNFLTQINAGITVPGTTGGWAGLSLTSAQFSVYITPLAATNQDTVAAAMTTGPNSLTATLQTGSLQSTLIELRYHPSSLQ